MREPTDLEKAYIAGIIDGEGCIQITGDTLTKVSVIVANTDVTLINFLQDIYGGHVCVKNPKSLVNCRSGRKRKPVFNLNMLCTCAERVMNDTLPYLKIKWKHVMVALKLRELVRSQVFSKTLGVPNSILDERRNYYDALRILNMKGLSSIESEQKDNEKE